MITTTVEVPLAGAESFVPSSPSLADQRAFSVVVVAPWVMRTVTSDLASAGGTKTLASLAGT